MNIEVKDGVAVVRINQPDSKVCNRYAKETGLSREQLITSDCFKICTASIHSLTKTNKPNSRACKKILFSLYDRKLKCHV